MTNTTKPDSSATSGEKCPHCKGKGYLLPLGVECTEKCRACNGTGVVAPQAATTEQVGITGPLTDGQRDECRYLYNNLGNTSMDAADNVIRRAAVYGYMNGRRDFAPPAATTASASEYAGFEEYMAGTATNPPPLDVWLAARRTQQPSREAAQLDERALFDKLAKEDGLDIERGFKDGYRDLDTRAAYRGFKLAARAALAQPAATAVDGELPPLPLNDTMLQCYRGYLAGTVVTVPATDLHAMADEVLRLRAACAAAARSAPAVPEGFKLVPIDPTEEMIDAALGGAIIQHNMRGIARRGLIRNYAAMLAAAPSHRELVERKEGDK